MKKKNRGHAWLWLIFIFLAGVAVLGGYYLGTKKGHLKQEGLGGEKPPVIENGLTEENNKDIETQVSTEGSPDSEKEKAVRGIIEAKPGDSEVNCKRMDADIRDFFSYLDKRNYIQHLEEGIDTYDRFVKLTKKLASSPPIPAGEGVDIAIMAKNIFHFFRLLDKNDLRLIKEILRNEADTLEMNLDLFYRWQMLGDQCPQLEYSRPSLQTLYLYAGYFLNTIGGRAYLFRRQASLRLLVSYYCLLIIHEADKAGLNSYGLDILPYLSSVQREMEMYSQFLFQNEYLQRLDELSTYYTDKR
ncbi:MAG: hypothetical protein ACOWYE_01570 [Desulfatiglandales bacterium]